MGVAFSKPCYPALRIEEVFTPSSKQKIMIKPEECTHTVITINFDSLTIWVVSHIYSTFCSTRCFIEYFYFMILYHFFVRKFPNLWHFMFLWDISCSCGALHLWMIWRTFFARGSNRTLIDMCIFDFTVHKVVLPTL